MQLRIISIGNKMPSWVANGFKEYLIRLPRDWRVELIEIPPLKTANNLIPTQIMQEEAGKLLACSKATIKIVLDKNGKAWNTEDLSQNLITWHNENQTVDFIIGGAYGLHQSILHKATLCWSLSKLTFPHQLVRIILIEQIYRAFTIHQNHPYHK